MYLLILIASYRDILTVRVSRLPLIMIMIYFLLEYYVRIISRCNYCKSITFASYCDVLTVRVLRSDLITIYLLLEYYVRILSRYTSQMESFWSVPRSRSTPCHDHPCRDRTAKNRCSPSPLCMENHAEETVNLFHKY